MDPNDSLADVAVIAAALQPTQPNEPTGSGEMAVVVLGMFMSAIGIVVNAVVVLALRETAHTRVPWLRALLTSLCAADALLGAASLALLAIHLHETGEQHAQHFYTPANRAEYCARSLFRYSWDLATNANLMTLLAMAVMLLVSVRWPHGDAASRLLSARGTAAAVTFAWLTSVAIAFAPAAVVAAAAQHANVSLWPEKAPTRFCYQLVLYDRRLDDGSEEYKYAFDQERHDRAYIALGVALTTVVFVTLSGVYMYIFVVIDSRRRRRLLHADKRQHRCAATASEGRLVIVVSLVTVLFLVCYLPLYVVHVLGSFYGQRKIDRETYAFLMTFMTLAPVVDPLLYALRLNEIRAGLRRVLAPCARLLPPPSATSTGGSAQGRVDDDTSGPVDALNPLARSAACRGTARPAPAVNGLVPTDTLSRDLTATVTLIHSNGSLARREPEKTAT